MTTTTTTNTVSQTLERINRDTQWDSLSQDQVSSVLIRMEDATVTFYESAITFNRKEHSAIQEFWDREWGCTYDWKKREWRYIASGKRFESESEKRAKRVWEERIDDEEQEQEQEQEQQEQEQQEQEQEDQDQLSWSGVDWLSAYDSYHDYGWYDKMMEQKQVTTATATATAATTTATATATTTKCQTVLYIEELSNANIGDPDWRMFIHYNPNSNRYIINGTRGNGHAGGLRGAPLPEIRLAFQYRSDVLDYLAWCMNSRPTCSMAMYAMCCESVATLKVDQLLSSRGKKTELYGYDNIRIRTADLREQLAVLRGLDSTYSNFDFV
jgi:hypothetical protein